MELLMNDYHLYGLELVCNAVTTARANLEEMMDDARGYIDDDKEDIIEGMLDNLQAVESQFDMYKDEWGMYQTNWDKKTKSTRKEA
tara:strand:- start:216 stop:473 length:258 start_codon:yes stop_codon:yes gene_type:complete